MNLTVCSTMHCSSERTLAGSSDGRRAASADPGYECPPNHQLVEVVEKLLGAKTEVVNYCTEAPFIQTLCPTLVLGPGSINQAHQPDEYLETRFIKPTRELITQVIHHFCWH